MQRKRINYAPEKEQPPSGRSGLTLYGVSLKSGYNAIATQDYNGVKDQNLWKQREEWGAIKVYDEISEDDNGEVKETSLLNLKSEDAIEIITKTTDVELLKGYAKSESEKAGRNRTSVINAINLQIKTITDGNL